MSASVHVWTIGLDEDPPTVSALLQCLSGEERVRAARFGTTQLRLRFVVAHGALRSILSRYIGLPPGRLPLSASPTGKPFVPDAHVAFNLSHSDGLAICAVTAEGEIGADVERIRPLEDAEELVERCFAEDEQRQYRSLDVRERINAFYSIWTRKEAFVKATGAGLGRELQSFEVEASPEATEPRLTSRTELPGQWSLRAFIPRPGYVGAVALDREIGTLELFDWSPSAAGCPSV